MDSKRAYVLCYRRVVGVVGTRVIVRRVIRRVRVGGGGTRSRLLVVRGLAILLLLAWLARSLLCRQGRTRHVQLVSPKKQKTKKKTGTKKTKRKPEGRPHVHTPPPEALAPVWKHMTYRGVAVARRRCRVGCVGHDRAHNFV